MPDKLPSEIIRITLDDATYKGTGAAIAPTYINYFFGNNGTGKTTIAKAIKTGSGVIYAPGKAAVDYLPLVYDQDFIDANMRSYHNLPGVFTMNEANVKIQEQIDRKTAEQKKAQKVSSDAFAEKDKKAKTKAALEKQLYKDCWDKTEELRTVFEATQEGKKGSKQKFAEEVKRHSPIQHDVEELKRMYDSVYSSTAKRYDRFNAVSDVSALDHISGCDILSLAIVNTSNTPFADFLKEVGATEWVRQGHADYHEKAGGKCPYCSQELPQNFEEILAASFDTQYQTNLQKLDAFLAAYRDTANALFVPLSRLPDEVYPAIDTKPYHDKLTAVKAVIAENIEKIKSKVAEPSKIIALDEVEPLLQELSDIISGFNRLIDANNDIVSAGPKKKAECKKAVFEQIAYTLKDVLEAYARSESALDAEIQAQQDIINTQKRVLDQLKEDLRILNSRTVETETAMKSINTMLRDSGFQGFELRPRHEEIIRPDGSVERVVPTPAINYEVVRTDTGKIAENLSEGEKNFIAFLYFQQLVFGRESADGDTREKIVVIDDPVSSMDSSALFIVSAQIRKMIEVCRNNADNRNPVVSGNFIKQIFILTHNAYFHREVTYAYANRYDFVSFYLIRKTDNKSSIRLCDCPNPDCPSERMNVNPVKNSYAALWDEYKDASSGIPLMSIIRRILEYYFLQLCGYEGSDLRKRILEENKDAFTHDDFGNEDYSKFELASAMLSYIAANSSGINDGMHYVDDCIDVKQCRDTFQMIFHHMGQDQHYEMMMGMK